MTKVNGKEQQQQQPIFAQNYAYSRISGSELRDESTSTVKLQLKVNGMEMRSLPLHYLWHSTKVLNDEHYDFPCSNHNSNRI